MERIRNTAPATEASLTANDGPSLTISQFCLAEGISLASYHKMKRLRCGPRTYVVPGTRLIRISASARRDWQRRMQEASQTEAAALEQQRREQAASVAGKAAAASALHISKRTKL